MARARMAVAETPAQVVARLPVKAQKRLADVFDQRDTVNRAKHAFDLAQIEFFASIYDALMDGVPAKYLATELGLSLSRIYQIKDDVAKHRDVDKPL